MTLQIQLFGILVLIIICLGEKVILGLQLKKSLAYGSEREDGITLDSRDTLIMYSNVVGV